MQDQKLINLKNKLLLKKKRLAVNAMVKENFGYAPRGSIYDKLIDEVLKLQCEVLMRDHKWYEMYERKYCNMQGFS